ncbi:MAG: cell filamentation protein Fic [Acidobacteria bacterium]|nr:MAG: cell filamentation protein Fic [Acidobacteriota bacterium]
MWQQQWRRCRRCRGCNGTRRIDDRLHRERRIAGDEVELFPSWRIVELVRCIQQHHRITFQRDRTITLRRQVDRYAAAAVDRQDHAKGPAGSVVAHAHDIAGSRDGAVRKRLATVGSSAIQHKGWTQSLDAIAGIVNVRTRRRVTRTECGPQNNTDKEHHSDDNHCRSQRIRDLVAKRTEPANRSEQEIAGYRDVLNTIHTNYAEMQLTSNLVLQLHRNLFQFVPGGGGRWKSTDNDITATRPDGTTVVRFKPLAPHLVSDAMTQLHDRYRAALDTRAVDPLLLVPMYVLDFLCIHPFADGNGRMARLLSLLLLYQAGYQVGRYISLETAIEETKEEYYDSLYASSEGWHEARHSLVRWWEYFVGVMLVKAYQQFEERVGVTNARRGAKRDMIRDAVNRLPNRFRYADLERTLSAVSRPTIARALRELRAEGAVRCVKPGRDASWEKLTRR